MNVKYINADLKQIGLNIKKLRMESGLKQEELGKGISTSITNISRWERGAVLPSVEMVLRMARFFNVSVNVIIDQS